MLFHEVYGYYYQALSKILTSALTHPIAQAEIKEIIEETAFSESYLSILPALKQEAYQLLDEQGRTPLQHAPSMPLTLLEKRWIKAMLLDSKAALFVSDQTFVMEGVTPLYQPGDIFYFDQYLDGDEVEHRTYLRTFHTIIKALHRQCKLQITYQNRRGNPCRVLVSPIRLEYSLKDDKFRLLTNRTVINLSRITSCVLSEQPADLEIKPMKRAYVVFTLVDERNALERVMLHFAHYEKQAERLDEQHYQMRLVYDQQDETELLIRILSFGPMIKVVEPASFIDIIKERLIMQRSCGLK